jgi:hypothetical protein
MVDRLVLSIAVTPDEKQQIEEMAHKRGYKAPDEYLRALIESDAEAHGEKLAFDDDDDDILANFRQGWHEAMTGNTHPLSELWDDIDDE